MKKKKFKGTLNGKKFTNENDFFNAFEKMLNDNKQIDKMSYEYYMEDDGVSENQLDLFENAPEEKNEIKDYLDHDFFALGTPNFESIIEDESKKKAYYQLIDKLEGMFEDFLEEGGSIGEPSEVFKDEIDLVKDKLKTIQKEYEKEFLNNNILKQQLNESNKRLEHNAKLQSIISGHLQYYTVLDMLYGKFNPECKEKKTTDKDKNEQEELNELLKEFEEAFQKIFG